MHPGFESHDLALRPKADRAIMGWVRVEVCTACGAVVYNRHRHVGYHLDHDAVELEARVRQLEEHVVQLLRRFPHPAGKADVGDEGEDAEILQFSRKSPEGGGIQ